VNSKESVVPQRLIKTVQLALLALFMHAGAASLVAAQSYPAEPIRIVVPFGPASGPDFAIRALQPTLADILKQSVRVENRPGANSIIGTRAVATAAPDGYTLLGASTGFSTIESTTSQPGFSPMRDFKPVGFSARSAGYVLVVSAKSPHTTMQDLIAAGKRSPVFYGSPGIGNTLHLVAAFFAEKTGAPVKHVPYPGVADAVLATARGEVDFTFATLAAVIGQIQSGDLRAIGYAGSTPLPELPSVPLVSGIAPGFRLAEPWAGLLAPARTPDSAIMIINDALKRANGDSKYKAALQAGGYTPASSSPNEFRAFLEQNISDWKQAAQAAGITPK
jgi:tripartite-type tricarboxylate transporter receptor subunit TctC